MVAHDKAFPNVAIPLTDRIPFARRASHVDPDCDASLDEIVGECLATESGKAGWDVGTHRAGIQADAFVAKLLKVHGRACTTAGGRADVKAIARVLIVELAHEGVTREWRAMCKAGRNGTVRNEQDTTDRRNFKRGMFAGFLYGMADAMSRTVDGKALVDA